MPTLWDPAPEQPTKLGRHRQLSPHAGIHVSPLTLGGMSIGDKWEALGMGSMDKERSFKLLDAFYDAGGNFIDTASNYQDETSEEFIGEWMESKGIRDQIVLATKYTTNYKARKPEFKQQTSYVGNNLKSMHISIADSLKKLRTTYIDILYVHWWDTSTSVEEMMDGLHKFVMQGKVLYLGISDTPAWVVTKANQYARDKGKTPFVIYQGPWNVLDRTFERDIIPMARSEGLALAPWNVLAGGRLRSDAEEDARLKSGENGRTMNGLDWKRSEAQTKMSHALEKVAGEVGAQHITAVAIAYLMQKVPYVFPIVGGRKVEHLHGNIEALDIVLTPEQIEYIESFSPFDPGFPTNMLGDGSKPNIGMLSAAPMENPPLLQAIRPRK